jgi:DNA-binding Xre family transcriptional regulator
MRKTILKTLIDKKWSVKKLHEETGIRYNSLNDFLKHNKGIGFNNLAQVCERLGLKLVKLE